MTEIRIPVTTIQVDKACTCTTGRMRYNGLALLTDPPQFPHKCNSCGKEENYLNVYPHLVHEPVQK